MIGTTKVVRMANTIPPNEGIPSFGGMVFAILTTFVVPIIYSIVKEKNIK